ncbi:MSMEG_4193 family putative phosphomutase [Nocardioides jiangxiensis]|uniref:MSMEG_4193 family putative phosphomutase n=1 Tax=Nocardioides jiangxiensis TaxID=3064524 RepID=A0ABT9AX93_9ACTN|nr:MSMEG_4193 family putative phosphomutase [Nocardioides sp. WY-20]MDO7866858.1 MSMEG_4193 family putative phosphomutase [Nocardioides sp. WY-20]
MATVILVRHGRSTANTSGVLAGRAPGVDLDDVGRAQAEEVARRIADAHPVAIAVSPLDRCLQTAAPIADATGLDLTVDEALQEVGYGAWQGRAIKELLEEPLWRTVQATPSAATFPDGECLGDMAERIAAALRAHDARIEAAHGAGAVWVAVSHGDPIKAALADALGLPFDHFQRIHVDPGSVSIVRYGSVRPTVLAMNTHAGELGWLRAPVERPDDAEVGGGAGPAARGAGS